jgi:cytochrome c2
MTYSPVVEEGRKLVQTFACRRCHVIGERGGGLAASLNRQLAVAGPEVLFRPIQVPACFMPNFQFGETHIIKLVNAILAEAVRTDPEAEEMPLVIHFEEGCAEDSVFTKYCGPCHKALTTRLGGLGKGEIGPNLSGLFSDYYWPAPGDGKGWSSELLERWVQNPREVVKHAKMPPAELPSTEFSRLLEILGSGARISGP